jgi:hypothetical protein
MIENLAEMIKSQNTVPPEFTEEHLTLPEVEVKIEKDQTPIEHISTATPIIVKTKVNIINLTSWFEKNHQNFPNINPVRLAIKNVDPTKTLVFTVSSGNILDEERELEIFKESHLHPMLDLPGIKMEVYKQGFGVISEYSGDFQCFVRSYVVRSGAVITLCKKVQDYYIPYLTKKVKRSDTEIDLEDCIYNIESKLKEQLNKESLLILYKQSIKIIESLTTIEDAIKWLLSKQTSVADVNHHLQIDGVIITLIQ